MTNGDLRSCCSLLLPELPHVRCDGRADLCAPFVLSIILNELSVRSHQVHDDGVVHLKTTETG